MSTIFQKVRLVALGTAHDLLDKVIDVNSPSALRQYVRDLEAGLGELQNEAAVYAGGIRTTRREISELESKISLNKSTIQKILAGTAENKEQVARDLGVETVRLQKDVDEKKVTLSQQEDTSAKMEQAVHAMDRKHNEMVVRVRELERIDRDTKAKEKAGSAVTAANKILDNSGNVSIDDIESKMRRRNDVANEKFDRSLSGIKEPEVDSTTSASVDELLSSLRPAEAAKA